MGRSEKDWVFVSDAHFTGRDIESIDAFLQFLDSIKKEISHLVILGDLFEFFFGFKDIYTEGHRSLFSGYLPIFNKLKSLYQEGIQIKYYEGNHDFFLQPFFKEQLGMPIEIYPKGSEERLGEKRVFLAHGDLSNLRDWTYRAYRNILKNSFTYRLMHLAGPSISQWVAEKLSHKDDRKYQASSSVPPAFRKFAHQKFLEGFDIVILGHAHFPEETEERIDGRHCRYYNVGDWMSHRSFLRFTPPGRFQLSRFAEDTRPEHGN